MKIISDASELIEIFWWITSGCEMRTVLTVFKGFYSKPFTTHRMKHINLYKLINILYTALEYKRVNVSQF